MRSSVHNLCCGASHARTWRSCCRDAWRPGRVKTIAKAADRVLCLFPFEPDYYREQAVAADYTGHPMANEIPMQVDAEPARKALGVDSGSTCIGLLPGSRMSEVEKLSSAMFDAADFQASLMSSFEWDGGQWALPISTQFTVVSYMDF